MAKPGQFVNISCDHFLKRPFGICEVDSNEGTFSIGVRVVGDGTREITQAEIGDVFDVLGPLGTDLLLKGSRRSLQLVVEQGYPLFLVLNMPNGLGFPCRVSWIQKQVTLSDRGVRKLLAVHCFRQIPVIAGIKGNVMDALAQLSEEELSESTVFVVGL